jgi:hypothetical protein
VLLQVLDIPLALSLVGAIFTVEKKGGEQQLHRFEIARALRLLVALPRLQRIRIVVWRDRRV